MPDRLTIHLVRHPRPAVETGVCYGQTDLGLAEPVAIAGQRLRAGLPAGYRVFSSPLQRCLQLAEYLSPQVDRDPRLMEVNFGAWENKAWDNIPRHDIDQWAAAPFDYVPPAGESAAGMASRVIAFADTLRSEAKAFAAENTVVIVSHQGPLRVLLAHWLDLPRASWLKVNFDFATSSCIELSGQGNRLLWLNR